MATEHTPSRNEEEYFARENAELIARLRAERDAARAQASVPPASMSCPRCSGALVERSHNHVMIDQCEKCGGIWLDRGELDILEKVDATSRRSFLSGLFGTND